MKKEKTKSSITISLNKKLFEIVENKFNNKSKYIEWLIYQDLLKNLDNDEIKKLIL